jgi:hypothetical protein
VIHGWQLGSNEIALDSPREVVESRVDEISHAKRPKERTARYVGEQGDG